MTTAVLWLPTLVTASNTVTLVAQLFVALTLPLGVALILGKSKVTTVKWPDVLRVIGVLVIPTTIVLAMRGLIASETTAGILGVAIGHAVTFIDDD